MKKIWYLIIFFLFWGGNILICPIYGAEKETFSREEIDDIIKGLSLWRWEIEKIDGREEHYQIIRNFDAIEKLYQITRNKEWIRINQSQQREIKNAFISLVEVVKQMDYGEKVETEEGSRFISQLYYIAGELKDPRAIPFLIKELASNGAQEALVKIGEPAIGSITEALSCDDAFIRRGAIGVWEIWLSGGILIERYDILGTRSVMASPSIPAAYIGSIYDVSTQTAQVQRAPSHKIGKIDLNLEKNAQVRNLLIKRLNDESPDVRESAVRALGNFSDTSLIPLIKHLSENDPYCWEVDASFRHGKKGEKIIIYPVREEAQRVIKLLEEKKKGEEKKQR